jgi:hypothetical protein
MGAACTSRLATSANNPITPCGSVPPLKVGSSTSRRTNGLRHARIASFVLFL